MRRSEKKMYEVGVLKHELEIQNRQPWWGHLLSAGMRPCVIHEEDLPILIAWFEGKDITIND